jgi:hypothetical protein
LGGVGVWFPATLQLRALRKDRILLYYCSHPTTLKRG